MKKIILMIVAMVSVYNIWAQDRTVTGSVKGGDIDETLPQVNILVVGTSVGTVTEIDGTFSIKVPSGSDSLVFKYVGYQDQYIDLSSYEGSNIDLKVVSLESSNVGLNTVVVSASKRKERVIDAPASVTVINSDKVTSQAPISLVDNLKNTPGVDIMSTGLVSQNVNVRGFNNIFSGALLTIVDGRIARVPSLRVNVSQLIPTNSYDIERMELVRGPGAALYGPNAADGVLAIFTKSPLDMKKRHETTVSLTGGSQSLIKPEFRHSTKITDKIGFKISGSYLQAQDFQYYDPREPSIGDSVYFGTVRAGEPFERDTTIDPTTFNRKFFIQNYSADARIDFRPTDDIDIILSGGFATLNGIELTGLGAGQGRNWRTYYGQMQFRWKDLFVQYFINGSDAGDTYLIPQVGRGAEGPHNFQLLIDKSKMHVAQIQHNYSPIKILDFTYGVDMLYTLPETEGTINGRFEDDDDILQVGGYIQSEIQAHEMLKFVLAGRVDYHSRVDGAFFSPRAAMVFKPAPRHNLRLTYNRAFSSPTSLNLFLDLSNGAVPNGINIRGIGNATGYDYRYGSTGMPQFIAPSNGQWYDVNDKSDNYVFFDDMVGIIAGGLAAQADLPQDLVNSVVGTFFQGITSDSGTVNNVDHITVNYVELLETGDLQGSKFDVSNFSRREQVKNSVTQTMEFGYKGILFDKLFVTADLYYTRIQNYVSPLTLASASVMFDPADLLAALGPNEAGGLLHDNLEASPFTSLVAGLLDNNPAYQNPNVVTPQSGTIYDELAVIIAGAASQIPVGSVTPDDENVNSDVILTYVNLGTIDVAGLDLGLTYQVRNDLSFSASYSHVNKDRIPLAGAQDGYVALNAPKHKMSVGGEYNNEKYGFVTRVTWRWQDGFPANSSVYVGDVKAANFVDFNVSYKAWFNRNLQLTLDVNNVLNYKFQRFPGTPAMGTLVFGKVAYTF